MPIEIEKKYFTLAEISESLGVSVNQLRIWQKKYGIRGIQKVEKGTLRFTIQERDRFIEIYNINFAKPADSSNSSSTDSAPEGQVPTPAMLSLISDSLLEIRNFLVKLRDSS